jgi:poly(3-hydroxybutyrate) depolymerase
VIYNGKAYTYYIAIPENYNPRNAMPMLISWHGAAGAGTAPSNAKATRDFWQATANANDFIVVAQTATGQQGGGWVPGVDVPILFQIMDDMYRQYNIDKNRVYGHGFSAGGHIMHAIMLAYSDTFAAYAISAGVLEAFAGLDAPANATRKIPVFVSIGLQDTTGPNLLSLTRSNHTVFNNAGWFDGQNYWIDEFNGGHQLDSNLPQKAWDKLCGQSLGN